MFKKENFEIVNAPQDADIIMINTCGFIESAKEEAINTILEMAQYKENGKCKYLIVIGCLVQRYQKDLEASLPEVDLFVGISEYDYLWEKIASLIGKEVTSKNTLEYFNRVVSTGNTTAYLKIAEGCSNRCTYCAIPFIRGPYISRPMDSILKEARKLAKDGFKEIIVIAQDTTKYGIDLYGEPKLAELLDKLCHIDGFEWIRFLYAYPESITDELIEVIKRNDKICNYFDIPLQHFSDRILKRMHRQSDSESIEKIIAKIRTEIPDVILRTTMIVGFPGEDEEDFEKLYEFVNHTKFEKLGVFKYSKEEGTPAASIQEQVHPKTKQSRLNKIMHLQQTLAKNKLEEKIGNQYQVLIDGISDDEKFMIARSYMDIPDEDGVIFISNDRKVKPGDFITCKIIDVQEYDLIGEMIEK